VFNVRKRRHSFASLFAPLRLCVNLRHLESPLACNSPLSLQEHHATASMHPRTSSGFGMCETAVRWQPPPSLVWGWISRGSSRESRGTNIPDPQEVLFKSFAERCEA